jgi:hypothetical protein
MNTATPQIERRCAQARTWADHILAALASSGRYHIGNSPDLDWILDRRAKMAAVARILDSAGIPCSGTADSIFLGDWEESDDDSWTGYSSDEEVVGFRLRAAGLIASSESDLAVARRLPAETLDRWRRSEEARWKPDAFRGTIHPAVVATRLVSGKLTWAQVAQGLRSQVAGALGRLSRR